MEIIFRNIPLVRSGYSEKRGNLSVGLLCMIPANLRSKNAIVHRGSTLIGRVENLTFIDLHNGIAELRGDIILDCSFATVVKMAFDGVYPVASISCIPSGKGIADYYLFSVSLKCKEEREFKDQQPLDMSEVLNMVNAIAKNKESDKGEDVNKGWTDHVRKQYIYAPNMTRSELINWLNNVLSALYTERSDYASQMADIEKKKNDINKDFNERMEILKKAFPQLDPESILSQDRKGVLI
ncbi:hypothetical protein ZI49_20750 [Salmonella enterica subsp. enterica]|nr:hypothetical protein [Salmonella enterica subsp. enterica]EDB3359498.1 hypothetical protein [Salmonella enterica subsp. enterica serovar Bredeney]EDS3915387.1 hypothetical protein [Salmonella enterica subsp. enterica]EHB3666844.1 hypothetical protein [Salmonella enterica subsp. enterica serovar Bredeney]